jgi:hypothetical protein
MSQEGAKLGGVFIVTCRDKFGNFKWKDTIKNTVVNEGLAYVLERIFLGTVSSGEANLAPWFVGLLTSGGSVSATDGISDLGEFTNYSGNRKEFVEVLDASTPAAPKMTNTANKASYTITQDNQTVGGAFLSSVDSGSSGTLLCGGAFTNGDKSDLDTDDTLEVQYDFTASSS